MKRRGYTIEIPDDWDGNDSTLLVNGKTELWEFLNNMQESKYELLKDHTTLITRHFDARVKSLFKNILMGCGGGKIELSHWSYRVEFQARGMPHIHGVAWIHKDELEKRNITGYLCDNPEGAIRLAGELLSCELPDSDDNLKAIVSEVQKHGHTKSCRKYTGNCRFGFPRLPSPETFMTKPLEMENDKEKEKLIKKAVDILKKAKEILDRPDCKEDMSFDEFLKKIGTSKQEYMQHLNISQKTKVLILKREISERFVNN